MPDWKSWRGEELEAYFVRLLAGVNGHNPQDRPDIAHEMITDLLAEKRAFAELHDPQVIRQSGVADIEPGGGVVSEGD